MQRCQLSRVLSSHIIDKNNWLSDDDYLNFKDMEGRRYMEYSNIYGAYNILVWFARKYPDLYINDDTKETVLHYAAAQVTKLIN